MDRARRATRPPLLARVRAARRSSVASRVLMAAWRAENVETNDYLAVPVLATMLAAVRRAAALQWAATLRQALPATALIRPL